MLWSQFSSKVPTMPYNVLAALIATIGAGDIRHRAARVHNNLELPRRNPQEDTCVVVPAGGAIPRIYRAPVESSHRVVYRLGSPIW